MTSLKHRIKVPSRRSPPSARSLALECLTAVLGQGRDVQEALSAVLESRPLDPRDKGLATELCYGYLRLKGRLDYVVQQFLRAPEKLPPELLCTLGVAAYELFYLDRVPAYATLDWAVDLARAQFGEQLSRLANGVLRKLEAEKEAALDIGYYRRQGEPESLVLARYYACPEWLVKLWRKSYGPERTLCYLKASAVPPLLGLRVNQRHADATALVERLAGHPACVARIEYGFAFPAGELEGLDADIKGGALSRQSLAAQETLAQLDPDGWRPPVWDSCAGRGGKACLLLERGLSPLWASDLSLARLKGLKRELKRLGLPVILVFRAAGHRPAPLKTRPRTVLLDVPCSGLGVLARRPDSKWRRTPRDLEILARTQAGLLAQGFQALAPGGALHYITCTLNPEENERQIERFLASAGPKATLEQQWSTAPDRHLGEFFWAATIVKR